MADACAIRPLCVCRVPAAELRRVIRPVRLLVADLDDTVLDLRHEEARAFEVLGDELNRSHGLDAAMLRAAYVDEVKAERSTQHSAEYSWHEARYVERFERVVRRLGTHGAVLDVPPAEMHSRLLELRFALTRPTPFAVDLLREVGRAAIPVVIFTHGTARIQRQRMLAAGVARYADQILTSEDVGCSKARLDVWWDAVCSSLRVPPAEALFLTDRVDPDITAATVLGLPSLWCRPSRRGHENDLAALLAALRTQSP